MVTVYTVQFLFVWLFVGDNALVEALHCLTSLEIHQHPFLSLFFL